jgi:hypothetical protein
VTRYYPRRKRCKTCQQYFSWLIIDRLYDSYECAGIKPPDPDPERWPREHAFRLQGVIVEKKAFARPDEPKVLELLEQNPGLDVYQCRYCWQFHMGHDRSTAEWMPL